MPFIVDTGAVWSVLPWPALLMLQRKSGKQFLKFPHKTNLQSASGHKFTDMGTFLVLIQCGNCKFNWPFVAVQGLTSRPLLGSNFLAHTGATTDCKTGSLKWPDPPTPYLVSLSSPLSVPPRLHFQVQANVIGDCRKIRLKENEPGIVLSHGSFQGGEVVDIFSRIAKDGTVPVLLVNKSEIPWTFRKGEVIGRYIPVAKSLHLIGIEEILRCDNGMRVHRLPPEKEKAFLAQVQVNLPEGVLRERFLACVHNFMIVSVYTMMIWGEWRICLIIYV